MNKAERSRIFWNSILLIVAAVLPLFLVLAAGAVTGNRVAWLPIMALWTIIPIVVLRRKKQRVLPSSEVGTKSFDKPLVACIAAGAIIGLVLTFVAGIQSSTQLADPGDNVTPVTSTYSVFGVAVAESTGTRGADSDCRFTQFESAVGLAFVATGMVFGLVVYLVGFRPRGHANSEPVATETTGG